MMYSKTRKCVFDHRSEATTFWRFESFDSDDCCYLDNYATVGSSGRFPVWRLAENCVDSNETTPLSSSFWDWNFKLIHQHPVFFHLCDFRTASCSSTIDRQYSIDHRRRRASRDFLQSPLSPICMSTSSS